MATGVVWRRYRGLYQGRPAPIWEYHKLGCPNRHQTIFSRREGSLAASDYWLIAFYGCDCTSCMVNAVERSSELTAHEILALGLTLP